MAPSSVIKETAPRLGIAYKAELIHAKPAWPSVTEVEFETMKWVHWWNTERLHEALDYRTPQEFEADHHHTTARATALA